MVQESKRNTVWFGFTIIVASAAIANFLLPNPLIENPMFVEMMGAFYGVLLALALEQMIVAARAQNRADKVKDELVEEIREAMEILDKLDSLSPVIYSLPIASIKFLGIPDRIEPELRKALSETIALLEAYNESLKEWGVYSLSENPDEKMNARLKYIVDDTKEKLIKQAKKVFELTD